MNGLEPLPDARAMRAADAAAIAAGTPGGELMERAGRGLADVVTRELPEGLIAVVCGKGNNGGDGYVAARLLREAGREVRVLAAAPAAELEGDARGAAGALTGDPPVPVEPGALDGAAGVVDCLLGTGTSGAPRGWAADAIRLVCSAGLPVVACDVPSGVDASTGVVAEGETVVRAEATVTFAAAKPGLWIHPGKSCAGTVHVVDIGLQERWPDAEISLTGPGVLDALPARGLASTKFSAGHVLVVGGSRGLTGAVCLAASAAARSGAGYVTALVPASLEAIFEVKLTEIMTRGLADADGALAVAAAQEALAEAARHHGALVLGGGLGRAEATRDMTIELAEECPLPLVLDADGLNAFAGQVRWIGPRAAATIITPHAGELGRLLGVESHAVERERLRHARAAAVQADAVVVLKGDDTLVAAPDGRVAVSPGGAPGLATAGTGDVLAGVCGAGLAAGLDPFTAAVTAVHLHLRAGQLAAQAAGSARAVIAGDVVARLGHAS
ncbi:MAG: NAD(P)H-hydrate epimerase / ADP-dependent (S)-NAD(P)H-hydrate dehydratase [uncultured Solirubrobacteraceae bacterium]|uniref:Bifunctional NAD(P)H-hydrate repair enzyme n=1 Tax=uncultured Solirubrobacteraceae bacterium TaxID=1162706 RepID=A0A6J4RS48_9ACTN|nr:MAG: NAD(P)H-hydrate epimerase / ADP-dependent (S)-NAD(P)H-hydrate dehydratase [uncultured Solirubrobacteraceae bacterium]